MWVTSEMMIKRIVIAFCSFLPTACIFGGPPAGLSLSTGAHPANPVLVHSLTINGVELNRMDSIVAAAWANPKGGGTALLSMPTDPDDKSRLHVAAHWTELSGNKGYTGRITARMSDLTVQKLSRRTGDVIVLFGPDGYLELSTSAPPDANGQYNGRIIATTCASAGPGLPQDHWVWQDAQYLRLKDDPSPLPRTECDA